MRTQKDDHPGGKELQSVSIECLKYGTLLLSLTYCFTTVLDGETWHYTDLHGLIENR